MVDPAGSIQAHITASLNTKRIHRANKILPQSVQWTLLKISLIGSDALLTLAAFYIAYWVRFNLPFPLFELDVVPSVNYYQAVFYLMIPFWSVIFALNGLYNRRNLLGGTSEYSRVFRAVTFSNIGVIIFGFLEPQLILARGWLIMTWVLSFVLVAGGRFWVRRLVYLLRMHGYFMSNAVIVGANDEGMSLAHDLMSWQTSGLNLLGFVDDNIAAGSRAFRGLFNLGNLGQLDRLVETNDIREIILVTSALPRDLVVSIFRTYGTSPDVNIRLSSGLYEVVTTKIETLDTFNVPLVRVNELRLNATERLMKLFLDYAIALSVLIFIAPMLLLLGLAIKLDSPGPVLHRRRVVGKYRKEFDAFKFRTMHVDGDAILAKYPELQAELARNHKLKVDPRITRVGHFLRKYSLDELPQLINVLLRQMSIVGPRIITTAEMEKYSKWDLNLLTVNPGLTGLWQVSGRSDTTYEERVRLDMQYIRTWTIWADIYILLRTIPAVLKGQGAY